MEPKIAVPTTAVEVKVVLTNDLLEVRPYRARLDRSVEQPIQWSCDDGDIYVDFTKKKKGNGPLKRNQFQTPKGQPLPIACRKDADKEVYAYALTVILADERRVVIDPEVDVTDGGR